MNPTFISVFIFTAYLLWCYFMFGILKSVSASYYELAKMNKGFIFTLVLWGFSLPVMIAGDSAWFFLAGSAIFFVGAAPEYKYKLEGDVHYAAAVLSILFGLIGIVDKGDWEIALGLAVGIALLRLVKNYTYWQELLAFNGITLYIILR